LFGAAMPNIAGSAIILLYNHLAKSNPIVRQLRHSIMQQQVDS